MACRTDDCYSAVALRARRALPLIRRHGREGIARGATPALIAKRLLD